MADVEFAHKIHEDSNDHSSQSDRRAQWIEIIEALALAIVAVATAWSGYQASKWDALSAKDYNLASLTAVKSQEKATLAGQDRLYDITTFNGWIAAKMAGKEKLADFYQRRFRPEYAAAFIAWQKLDPRNNPLVPPGPIFMTEYKNANGLESANLTEQAMGYYEKGVTTRDIGDKFVKITVLLATVLLLTALGQRFEIVGPRAAVVTVASILLVVATYWLLTLPRA